MSTLLKDLYSPSFIAQFADSFQKVLPTVNKRKFIEQINTPAFADYELKERMAHIAHVLHKFLPQPYANASVYLTKLIDQVKKEGPAASSIEYLFLPEYIHLYGLDDYMSSIVNFINREVSSLSYFVSRSKKIVFISSCYGDIWVCFCAFVFNSGNTAC